MHEMLAVFRREFAGYFQTPLAYVFIVIFLFLTGVFTFYFGSFFERGEADLQAFFLYHPWLYLFLVPAIAMRLWAEERATGSIEFLMTLPIPLMSAVLGKFFAAWAFLVLALSLTFPIWLTVNFLGEPDNGVILAAYIGSALMAGGYLAISGCISAMTGNQVIAFVVAVTVCFLFTVAGLPLVLDSVAGWAPQFLIDLISSFSFLAHFHAISRGVIDLRDLIYFATLMVVWGMATVIIVDLRKAD